MLALKTWARLLDDIVLEGPPPEEDDGVDLDELQAKIVAAATEETAKAQAALENS